MARPPDPDRVRVYTHDTDNGRTDRVNLHRDQANEHAQRAANDGKIAVIANPPDKPKRK